MKPAHRRLPNVPDDAYSFVILSIGKRRIACDKLVDGEQVISCSRAGDGLLVQWSLSVDEFDPPDEAAEMLVEQLGDVLRLHKDPRGILIAPTGAVPADTSSATYASLVAAVGSTARWIPNISDEEGATGAALERREIPLPDVPRSRGIEFYLLSPARAMRELGLADPPMRVACVDRDTTLAPNEVIAFYAPRLKEQGFTVKRRVWSDGSTEQLVGHTPSHHVIVHAEKSGKARTFARLAWISKPVRQPDGTSVVLAPDPGETVIVLTSSASSWNAADAVTEVPRGMRARIVQSTEVPAAAGKPVLRYEVEVVIGHEKRRGWVHARAIRTL